MRVEMTLTLCCNSATVISHLPVYEVPVSSLNGEYWSWLKSSPGRAFGWAQMFHVAGGVLGGYTLCNPMCTPLPNGVHK